MAPIPFEKLATSHSRETLKSVVACLIDQVKAECEKTA
jgi:hypothetical protein